MKRRPRSLRFGGGPGMARPGVTYGSDIRNWMYQPGDQILVMPNGTYNTGGDVNIAPAPTGAAHGSTAGPYGGWLVLQAESQGGVTVDLRNGGMHWLGGVSGVNARIAFVGINFINGLWDIYSASYLRFWYCTHTAPIETWWADYTAAGGSLTPPVPDNARLALANFSPSAFRIKPDTGGPTCTNIEWYGCDIHDCGDDGIYCRDTNNCVLQGAKVWNIAHKGFDPDPAGAPADYFHNDALQTNGPSSNFDVSDTWFGQHVQWAAESANVTNFDWVRLWIAGSGGVGMNIGVGGWTHNPPGSCTGGSGTKLVITGTMDQITVFANGQEHPTDAGYNVFRVEGLDDQSPARNWSSGSSAWTTADCDNNPARIVVPVTNYSSAVPSGVRLGTQTNPILVDVNDIVTHAQNPANLWRAAAGHAYTGYRTFFGWP